MSTASSPEAQKIPSKAEVGTETPLTEESILREGGEGLEKTADRLTNSVKADGKQIVDRGIRLLDARRQARV